MDHPFFFVLSFFSSFEKHTYHTLAIVLGTAILARIFRCTGGARAAEMVADVGEARRSEQQRSEVNELHVWSVRE